MVRIRSIVVKNGFNALLHALAWMARRPGLAPLSSMVGRGLASASCMAKGITRVSNVTELGLAWQRSFPSAKPVPIESVVGSTVVARIHTTCPLRGTGDVEACYRMMEFDRAVVGRAGGRFVVLSSQATPGIDHCRVAMRMADSAMDDLVPAHVAARKARPRTLDPG